MKPQLKTDNVARIANALPKNFDFYHLGVVRMQSGTQDDLWSHGARAIGFSLEGDLRAALMIRVEFAEDLSVYAEMGNIIASQLATALSKEKGVDVLISPPRMMSAKAASRLMAAATQAGRRFERRTYLHLHQKTVPVDAWIMDTGGKNLFEGESETTEASSGGSFDTDAMNAPGAGNA